MNIPHKMTNEESKLYAAIIVNQRALAVAQANINAAKRKLGI